MPSEPFPSRDLRERLAEAGLRWIEASAFPAAETFPWPARLHGVIQPADAGQAAAAVAIAGHSGLAVHPVSRGRNWGLGSVLPARDAVLIDLSRLDAILDLDLEAGTARVEPGVTFAQLQAALQARGLRYHLPSFGGPPDASVLANALERGEGAGPRGDRFGGLFDLDVALSTGERFRTGFGRHAGAAAASIGARHGRPAGPLIDGLFSQSGLGLVLSGRVTLNPTLAHAVAVMIRLADAEAFSAVVPAIERLLRNAVLHPHDIAIWNDAKRVSSLDVWRDPSLRMALTASTGWGLSLILASDYRPLLEARLALVEEAFRAHATEVLVADDRDGDGARLETHLTGFSHGMNVASCYAMKPALGALPLDPVRDRCGFAWLCPVLPLAAPAIRLVETMMTTETRGTRVFPAIGFQVVSPAALHGYLSLAWDREDSAAEMQALRLHARLAAGLAEAGFAPFRHGYLDGPVRSLPDTYDAILARIADAVDPSGVMSPGRLRRLPPGP